MRDQRLRDLSISIRFRGFHLGIGQPNKIDAALLDEYSRLLVDMRNFFRNNPDQLDNCGNIEFYQRYLAEPISNIRWNEDQLLESGELLIILNGAHRVMTLKVNWSSIRRA